MYSRCIHRNGCTVPAVPTGVSPEPEKGKFQEIIGMAAVQPL